MAALVVPRTLGKLKPLARALRAPPLSRSNGPLTLSRELEQQLFSCAHVLSEGGCRTSGSSGPSYFGSTMISIDFDRLLPMFRGGLDLEVQQRLLEAVDGSVRVRLRAMRLACAEAARRVPGSLGTAFVETRVRLSERQLHIDVDLEVAFRVSSASRRS